MTRIDVVSFARAAAETPLSEAAADGEIWQRPRNPADDASLRRLEDYIRRDRQSLSRQRAILAECEGPARVIAEATVAEYELSLATLYRRRARLLAKA